MFPLVLCWFTPFQCQPFTQKGQQSQQQINNQLSTHQMPQGVCGHSPHTAARYQATAGIHNNHCSLGLFVEVRAAGAAPSHCKAIIMAMEASRDLRLSK